MQEDIWREIEIIDQLHWKLINIVKLFSPVLYGHQDKQLSTYKIINILVMWWLSIPNYC